MNFISLFSGIGGFDLGFGRADMHCAAQVEIDAACRDILGRHWPHVPRFEDVRDVGKRNLPAVELICGGFPCQDVSRGNQQRAGLDGERSGLWFEFHRILTELKPKWCVIENVPGLLSSNEGRDFATIVEGLVECGYGVAWRVVDAQYFGVAQKRERVFIVGHLGDGRAAEILFDEAGRIGDYAPSSGEKLETASYPPDDPAWWNGRVISQTLDAVLYKKQALPEKNRFPAVVVPAWTECECCGDFWCNLHGMHAYDCSCPPVDEWAAVDLWPYAPSVLRFITPTEAERLQGFPDGWTDGQSDSARYHQLGNAVCVNVIEWLGHRIVECLP